MFIYYFHVYMYVCELACMYMHIGMQGRSPQKSEEDVLIPWNWIYNYHVCCEENPGLLQKQKIALNH